MKVPLNFEGQGVHVVDLRQGLILFLYKESGQYRLFRVERTEAMLLYQGHLHTHLQVAYVLDHALLAYVADSHFFVAHFGEDDVSKHEIDFADSLLCEGNEVQR